MAVSELPVFAPVTAQVDGHDLRLVVAGQARLDSLLLVIEAALVSLRLYYYIFAQDTVGSQVCDALIAARARGVTVSLVVDGYGSEATPEATFARLAGAGIHFDRFVPRWGRRFLVRNHQKMLIADDRVAVIGGSNIAALYFADDPAGKSWHDLLLVIEGPAAARLGTAYDALTGWVDGDLGTLTTLNRVLTGSSEGQGPLRWVMGGPFRRLNPLVRALKRDIDRATQIDMIQAYFAPNWGLLRKLGHAARRGRVRLITASRSDNVTTVSAARHCYRRLLRYGAEIMEYRPQMLHVKLIVADDAVWIGSANFDIRSLYINTELALRVEDKNFADAMRALVDQHRPWCEQVTGESHRLNSPLIARIVRLVSYFIVATLDFRLTRRFTLPGRS
ncbi:MAG: hypothetical protein RL367_2680 [Pseudomonadota bacterium]